ASVSEGSVLRRLRTGRGANLGTGLAGGAESDEGADEGSVLRRLVGGQVARFERPDLAAVGLLDDDEVDESDDVLLAEACELRKDLTSQPVSVELEDQHLDRTEFHGLLPILSSGRQLPARIFCFWASNSAWVRAPAS